MAFFSIILFLRDSRSLISQNLGIAQSLNLVGWLWLMYILLIWVASSVKQRLWDLSPSTPVRIKHDKVYDVYNTWLGQKNHRGSHIHLLPVTWMREQKGNPILLNYYFFYLAKKERKKGRLLFLPENVVLKAMLMVCPVSGDKSWANHVTFRGQLEMKFLATGTEALELFNRHCFGVERSKAHSYLPSISLPVLGYI